MKARAVTNDVFWIGAIDWERRLFDALIPLPDGTSYNAYYIKAGDKNILIDSVDPHFTKELLCALSALPPVDYIVSHHTEQDHSGSIPAVLEKYPNAVVLASGKGKESLIDHLPISADRIRVVVDGEIVEIGNKRLQFFNTPWVHWPETMVSYLIEDKILFPCDLFGSHLATTELFADKETVYSPAKRYYAEIMMPFRVFIDKHLKKLSPLEIKYIAPSHGPVYDKPEIILDAYKDWVQGKPKNLVVLPYISMHGSTKEMVDYFIGALVERGVNVEPCEMTATDLGKLAMLLVDAATIVVGTPTVLTGAHPLIISAAYLANALKPKAKFVSIIGSFGWGSKVEAQLKQMMGGMQVDLLNPVFAKGLPKADIYKLLDELAETIANKHKEIGAV